MAGTGSNGGPDASGLAAGMTIIAGILLGAGIDIAGGLLLDRLALGIMVGSTVGWVLGFYLLYVQYFKPR